MGTLSLIANTGIQFIDLEANIEENGKAIKRKKDIGYILDGGYKDFALPEYDDESDTYIDAINGGKVEEHQITSLKAKQALSCFEGEWLPFPYFREMHNQSKQKYENGPLTWCRIFINPAQNKNYTHDIVLAFDTTSQNDDSDENINESSYLIPQQDDFFAGKFSLATDFDDTKFFLQEDWIFSWIEKIIAKNAKKAGIKERVLEENEFLHIGLYSLFLEMLNELSIFPPLTNIGNDMVGNTMREIEVDLVLDIGNSRSCGLLLETSKLSTNSSFSFANSSILELRNLTIPTETYSNAFEMRCEFNEANFGDRGRENAKKSGNGNAFLWASLLRVGEEAVKKAFTGGNSGSNTGMSSPKRYLWDNEKRKSRWLFNGSSSNVADCDFAASFLDGEGRLKDKNSYTDMDALYPRKSLMIFSLTEIILQAITQINSYKFRQRGDKNAKRVLKRLVLTCPTAMLESDKKSFRDSAKEAINILREFYGVDTIIESDLRVIPDPDDVGKIKDKTDWGFDEATCTQLAFIYGEIKRYQGKKELFFQIEGKKREFDRSKIDKLDESHIDKLDIDSPAVTIASLDIGGGTTDLMICSYRLEPSSYTTVLTPFPEFYEGFNLAGDDIVKNIIQKLIIPTIIEDAKKLGSRNSATVANFLFSEDIARHTEDDKRMRKLFALQIAIPIAQNIIQHSIDEKNTELRSFESFYRQRFLMPRSEVIEHINKNFQKDGADGFDLRKVQWMLDSKITNYEVVINTVDTMLKKLSSIIAQFNCDYLLLTGRPTMLPIIRKLINIYMPLTPNKIISLANYRIGKWYPFAKSTGIIDDPKTTVVVGAAVGLMAGTLSRLDDFRINTIFLKNNIKSTANYIGGLNTKEGKVENVWFMGDNGDVKVVSFHNDDEFEEQNVKFHGKMFIGMRQMNTKEWMATPMYKIDFKNNQTAVDYRDRLPLTILLERGRRDKEKLQKPREIMDRNGNRVSNDVIVITPQTVTYEDSYWIDTGVFHTSIIN